MKKWLAVFARYRFSLVILFCHVVLLVSRPALGFCSLSLTWEYVLEMLSVIPPIFSVPRNHTPHPFPSSQKATALAAATFRESTPWDMGIRTV